MKGGGTYMDHLQSVVRQTGGRVVPPELRDRTECPERAMYLWNYFAQASRRRQRDGFSGVPQPLSSFEILSWAALNRVRLQTFEVDLLTALDDTFVDVKSRELVARQQHSEKSAKPAKEKK